jgi:predicted nucleotidyltransferase
MIEDTFPTSSVLSDEFLSDLIAELDNDNVIALALVGSYARGNATLYSDVDVLRFVREVPERTKQYIYRHGRLIGISTRTFGQYRKRLTAPEEAIFVVPSIREAHVLLDKEGEFARLQQEAQVWTWEPLQATANDYASYVLMVQIEIVHKTLRALMMQERYCNSPFAVRENQHLRPSFYSLHRNVIDQVIAIIGQTLRLKKVT